jgi:predicted ATPase
MFVTRARAVAPSVSMDRELAAAICERLDRLPLAIELTAARTKMLSPAEILDRLERRLPVTAAGPRDAPQRQRTLKATIDWSHNLLNVEERQLFARLSVFAGGWTLAAAQTVCGADLDPLQALVDRSLVRRDGARYSMLVTIREYALERLEQTGEDEELRRAHAQFLADLLEAERLPPPGWPDANSLRSVAPEQDNFTAALEWASATGRSEILARLAGPLVGVWVTQGRLHEARRWVKRALEAQTKYSERLSAGAVSRRDSRTSRWR